jgi:hypothetical protein
LGHSQYPHRYHLWPHTCGPKKIYQICFIVIALCILLCVLDRTDYHVTELHLGVQAFHFLKCQPAFLTVGFMGIRPRLGSTSHRPLFRGCNPALGEVLGVFRKHLHNMPSRNTTNTSHRFHPRE